jgi:hypothetical protein
MVNINTKLQAKFALDKERYDKILTYNRERYHNMTPEEKKEYYRKNYNRLKQRIAEMSPEDRYNYYHRRNQKHCAKLKGMTVQEYKEYQIQKQIDKASKSMSKYQSKLAELKARKEKLNN